ncbi:MAG: DUF7000 family protein, partial [Coriobacteriia bacterium]
RRPMGVFVVPLGEDLTTLKAQLGTGSLQRAYGSIIGYMSQLRSHYAAFEGERVVSGLYQGYFDMTYFALYPAALKSRGLKLAIVFNYESFDFQVWLAARNRAVQRRYWQLLRDNGWSGHRLVQPAAGIDAIVESDITDAFALVEPDVLTARIEAAAQELLDQLLGFLDQYDSQETVS